MRQSYLIEEVLPEHELHIFAGPSGAGKTRLLFQGLREWQQNQTFLGFKCKPFPETLYLACDRSKASIEETLASFPGIHLDWDSIRGEGAGFLTTFRAKHPHVKLLILDGIATLVPEGKVNEYGAIASFLCTLGKFCTASRLTILGIGHSAKTKENEKYSNPRQRILGSVAWAAYAETIFNLEPTKPDDPTQTQRRLFIGPRNYREHIINLEMNDGLLVPAFNPIIEEAPTFSKNESVIYGIVGTGIGERWAIVAEAEKINMSRASADRALESLVLKRVLRSVRKGVYEVEKTASILAPR